MDIYMDNANKWFILNSDGKIVNSIIWDGNTENWGPPEDCTVIHYDDVDFETIEWYSNE